LEAGLLEDDAPKEGERLLKEAVFAAESGPHLSVLVEAWDHLAWNAGYLQQHFADADEYAHHAVSVLDGLGHDPRLELQTLRTLAVLRHAEGKHDQAEKYFQQAIALCDRSGAALSAGARHRGGEARRRQSRSDRVRLQPRRAITHFRTEQLRQIAAAPCVPAPASRQKEPTDSSGIRLTWSDQFAMSDFAHSRRRWLQSPKGGLCWGGFFVSR
jgi:hypothetical protein